MKKYFLLFVLANFHIFSQAQQKITVGITIDENLPETQPLLESLKTNIRNVIGQGTEVEFLEAIENNFDVQAAKSNYNQLVESHADIILSFGVVNNIVIYEENLYPKPTIVFGSVNSDFMDLPENKTTSGINNITYIITPMSYKEDLEAFKSIYNFKKLGIIVDDYMINTLPIKNLFDSYFSNLKSDYKLIPISKGMDVSSSLNDVDAVYLAGGFYNSDDDLKKLIKNINSKKLPSFSAFEKRTVEMGILATNQPETNIEQFFRRIALDVEAILEGTNASELPMLIDYKNKLTINHSTASQIEFPLRYSMLAKADFVEGNNQTKTSVSLSILDILNDVVDNNLSLKSERKNIELAGQDIKTAKSNFLPDITANAKSSLLRFKEDDILLGAMRVYFHRVCNAIEDGISRSTIMVLRPQDVRFKNFCLFTLNRDETIEFANKNSTGSSIPYAKWEKGLSRYKIAVANNSEIFKNFNKITNPILNKFKILSKENQKLSALRDWLLPMLMNGQVTVGEVEQELGMVAEDNAKYGKG